MTPLREYLDDYLATRRALGYRLEEAGTVLEHFLDHLEASGDEHITVSGALDFASSPEGTSIGRAHVKLSAIRGFAAFAHVLDPVHEVPPADLLPYRVHRATPHLYSDEEVSALLAATTMLRGRFRQRTYETLIGLLVVTGLRIGEAIALDVEDIDLDEAILYVWHGKFGKSRQIPLHASTVDALGEYLELRRSLAPSPRSRPLFMSGTGNRLEYKVVLWSFRRLVGLAALDRDDRCGRRPHIHDFRHSFAVKCLLEAYRDGANVEARLAILATFLGHVNPANTYWYLSSSPALLEFVGDRLETYLGGRP